MLFAVVHAVVSKVGVVSVGIVGFGFGFDNYGLAACYTVDLVLADFVWKYFETIETEMVDGAAVFEEIVVVVVVVVGTGIAVVVGKVIVVVVGKAIVVVVVGKVLVVVVVGKVIVVVGKAIVVVGKMIVVVVDIDHMAAVALVEQQQNFPLNDMAVAV